MDIYYSVRKQQALEVSGPCSSEITDHHEMKNLFLFQWSEWAVKSTRLAPAQNRNGLVSKMLVFAKFGCDLAGSVLKPELLNTP